MCDVTDKNLSCKCRMAVLNAYYNLTEHHRTPEIFAFQAACRVYRHHHPEDSKELSCLKVESWINAGHLH